MPFNCGFNGGPLRCHKLGDHIKSCLQQAEDCKATAASEKEERVRAALLALEEQQWQHVAKSYEFIASLERFLLDQQNEHAPPPGRATAEGRPRGLSCRRYC